ncbi:MAG: AarF/ABC1/UbiB kinase family protein, partial [Halobacteriaceae archaeon]
PSPDQLKQLFEDLGGAFIKLGQLLSLRPDLIPKEYCDAFSELQDNVPPFEQAETVIEGRYGELDSLVLQPIASASIGQVH